MRTARTMTGLCSQSSEPHRTITPRRRIQKHAKSRTGCITCKIRRKKCDEERPSCRRCTETGRKCDGYSVQQPTRTRQEEMPKLLSSKDRYMQDGCSWTLLEFFRSETIPTFSSYYDSTLWEITLAQTSVSEVLRSAAVAFAAAHYERETGRTHGLTLSNQRNLTMTLYTDAISKARRALRGISIPSDAVRIGFIVSFMLAGIETLRGSKAGVILHLANGLKVAFSQGYDTIKFSWKINAPELMLKDAVTSLIARLNAAIEQDFDKRSDERYGENGSFYIEGKPPKAWHSLRDFFQQLSNLTRDIIVWLQDPAMSFQSAYIYSKDLEHCATTLQKLSLNPYIDRHTIRLLRLYGEGVHLLLLCHLNDAKSLANTDYAYYSDTFESRSIYLKAYFSKLSIIEESLRHNRAFVTHLSPASLKQFAVRHSLIYPWSSENACATRAPTLLQPPYSEIERLVMLEENAILESNLVPMHAMCMEVTSALDQGSVSIRYCVVGKDEASLDWVEKKASLWKPVVFVAQGQAD